MAEIKSLYLSILLGCTLLFCLGGIVSIMLSDTGYPINNNDEDYKRFITVNESLRYYNNFNDSVNNLNTMQKVSTDFTLFNTISVLGSAIQSAWGATVGIFKSIGFFYVMMNTFAVSIGIPVDFVNFAWMGIIIVIIFAFLRVLFQVEL